MSEFVSSVTKKNLEPDEQKLCLQHIVQTTFGSADAEKTLVLLTGCYIML